MRGKIFFQKELPANELTPSQLLPIYFSGMLNINAILLIALLTGVNSWAAEQVLDLKKGWNAVSLELAPTDSDPGTLFAGKPVEMVSLWLPSQGKVVSLTDPAAIPEKVTEWHTWQPASSPSAFLNNLRAIPARTPLLIKASAACQLTIAGSPSYQRTEWVGSSFNLVGFDIDSSAPPTFARFFDGSRAHRELKIYHLVAERWQPVNPTTEMKRGTAYWVWTSEGSDFQGPIDLELSGQGLNLSSNARTTKFQLRKNGQLALFANLSLSGDIGPGLTRSAIASAHSSTLGLSLRNLYAVSFLTLPDGATESGEGTMTIRGGGMHIQVPVKVN